MARSRRKTALPTIPPPAAVDAAFALRRLLLRTADALLPATAVVWDRTMGVERTQVIGVLAELGVADELAGGAATAAELAPGVGADADALHRVMRAAAVDGLLKLDRQGRFKLTRLGRTLISEAPSSLRPWARYMALASTHAAWGDLLESVRTGRSSFERVHGAPVWDWFVAHPEEEQLFAGAMRGITDYEAPALAASAIWPDEGTICDVAGGAGTLLAAVLASRPRLKGILVETPGVLREAKTYLESQGILDRVELVQGDLFGDLRARADVYAMKNILHDWDDPTSAKIVATVRATMVPGSRLVLAEQLQERNVAHPLASLVDLQMLTQTVEGRERSREELFGLLEAAGLTRGRLERVGACALVEGRLEP